MKGSVADAAGAVIPFATVTVRTGVKVNVVARGARDGSFRVDDLPPGVYEVGVYAAGFASQQVPPIQLVADSAAELGTIRLQVGSIGACVQGFSRLPTLRFELCEDCATALEGSLARTWNLPLPGVEVALVRGNGETAARMVTGADGKFTFVGLPPGLYTLQASKPEHAGFVIDAVAVHSGQRTRINERLPLDPCPAGVRCGPVKKVDAAPDVCL